MPGSAGTRHSTRSDIRQLREIIDNYGLGFPLIKELLQNADDASATCLDIGWTAADGRMQNPLLRAPSLFVLNNGPFSAKDEEAILSIGESFKPDATGTIGKFGRGLKSVFHVCEGFVFMHSAQRDASGPDVRQRDSKLYTPWKGDEGLHAEWYDYGENDHALLVEKMKSFLPDADPWFALWIPLRQEKVAGLDFIKNLYEGDKDVPPDFVDQELPTVRRQVLAALPLLSNVKTVRFWLPRQDGTYPSPTAEVRLDQTATRRRFRAYLPVQDLGLFGGSLQVAGDGDGPFEACFAGSEVLLSNDTALLEMERNANWPSADGTITGKAPAHPHAAAVFTATPSIGLGRLRVSDAVFLPVGRPSIDVEWRGNWDIDLSLHGYFFVDSNRSKVEFDEPESTDESKRLRSRWNRTLRERGTLPLVIPALSALATVARLDHETVAGLTRALQHAFGSNLGHVSARHQWVACIESGGGVSYKEFDAGAQLFEIPSAKVETVSAVLPGLQDLASERNISLSGTPRLASLTAAPWPAQDVERLLAGVNADALRDEVNLEFLCAFLVANEYAVKVHPATQGQLVRLLKLLVAAGLTASAAVTRMLPLVDSTNLFYFDRGELAAVSAIEPTTAWLAGLPTRTLLLSRGASTPNDQNVHLSAADALIVLAALASAPSIMTSSKAFLHLRTAIATSVIAALPLHEREAVLADVREAPLFLGWDGPSGEDLSLSLAQLEEAAVAGCLVDVGSSSRAEVVSLAKATQAAVTDARILIADKNTGAALHLDALPGSREGAATIVLRCECLAGAEQRRPLLKALLQDSSGPSVAQAVRYLLHGTAAARGLGDPLVVGAQSDAWGKLVRQALGQDAWQFVDRTLAEEVPGARWAEFELTSVSAESATKLLRSVNPSLIDCSVLSEHERGQVVEECRDDELLRSLPVHRGHDGTLRAIDSHTYVESKFELSPRFGQVVLLAAQDDWVEAKLKLRRWTPSAAVGEALSQAHPGRFAEEILDALATFNVPLGTDLVRQLRSVRWLPLTNGGFVRPDEVVHLAGLDADIARIAAHCGGAFIDIARLDGVVREHQGFSQLLRGVFLIDDEALRTLPLMIEEAGLPQYHIGAIELGEQDLDGFVRSFEGGPSTMMEAANLLHSARQLFGPESLVQYLVRPLLKPLSVERTIGILSFLGDRHESARVSEKAGILRLFEKFLSAPVEDGSARDFLPGIRLLTENGDWRSSAQLCHDRPNVDPAWLVKASLAECLGISSAQVAQSTARTPGTTEPAPNNNDSAQTLRSYFSTWRNRCPDEAIGGFLAFLGDDAGIRDLAQFYLGQRQLETVRDLVGWQPLPEGIGGGGKSVATTMASQRFLVEVVPRSAPQAVLNLLGETIEVPTAATLNSLVQNRLFESLRPPGPTTNLLCLFAVDPTTESSRNLSDLLRASTLAVLGQVYWQEAFRGSDFTKLDAFWSDLEQSHLVDLRTAQEVIVHHLLASAKLLKVGPAPKLRALVRAHDEAIRERIDAEKIPDETQRLNKLTQADERTRGAKRDLEALLVARESETTTALLHAVRLRIRDEHHYSPGSVLFELFQNADDAAVELRELGANSERRHHTFAVEHEPGILSVVHWGRRINEFRPGANGVVDVRDRDFHRDLEKMIMLGASDKGLTETPGEAAVTGKFGLGFKSVFLLTDAPRIISGRLAVEVVGGTYPALITGSDYEGLSRRRETAASDDATLFEFPMTPEQESDAKAALTQFRTLAPFLAAFAKETHAIEIRVGPGVPERFEWAPMPVEGVAGCAVGSLSGAETPSRALLLVSQQPHGALMLGLDARGFTSFPASIPGVWVTAPTTEAHGIGYALNGPFELHPGRAQLASPAASVNEKVAGALGRAIGSRLRQLADAEWGTLKESLFLSDDADPYEFWESLLMTLTPRSRGTDTAGLLLQSALWGGSDRAAARLFRECRVLPSGLPGEHRRLLLSQDVLHRVEGLLTDETVFRAIASLHAVADRMRPGSAINTEVLNRIPLRGLVSADKLDLAQALQWQFPLGARIAEPDVATTVGAVLERRHVDVEKTPAEAALIYDVLKDVRFRAMDGAHHPASELLVGHDAGDVDADEPKRAAFAPTDCVLSDEYGRDGVNFFVLCRGALSARAETMLEWGRKADSPQRRAAFIRYIESGERARSLQVLLRENPIAWLEGEDGRAFIEEVTGDKDATLRLEVNIAPQPTRLQTQFDASWSSQNSESNPVPSLSDEDVDVALRRVVEWWGVTREGLIEKYNDSVYPDGVPVLRGRSTDALSDTKDPEVRRVWIELLILGASHRLGGFRTGQHRGFLEQCLREGWIDVFAEPHDQSTGEKWIGILRGRMQPAAEREAYFHWLSLFVPIFQLTYKLDEYVEHFLNADRFFATGLLFDQFLTPANAAAYQGGGLSAPPLSRAMSIGAHFVLREMARAGLLAQPAALEQCFVPRQSVRALFQYLSCPGMERRERGTASRSIAQFLRSRITSNWSLSGDFDIPFDLIAGDAALQRSLLETTIARGESNDDE